MCQGHENIFRIYYLVLKCFKYSGVSNNCRAYNYYFSKFFQGLQSYLGAYIYWFLALFQSLRLYIFVVEVFWWKWNKNWIRKVAISSDFEIIQLHESMGIFIRVFIFLFSYFSDGPMLHAFQFFQGLQLLEGLHLLFWLLYPGPTLIWGPMFIRNSRVSQYILKKLNQPIG